MPHADALRCYILNQNAQKLNQAFPNCMHFVKSILMIINGVHHVVHNMKKHTRPIEITKPRSPNLEEENPLPESKDRRHLGPHVSLLHRLHLLGVAHVHGRSCCCPCTFCDRKRRCEPPLHHCTSKPGSEPKSMHARSIF